MFKRKKSKEKVIESVIKWISKELSKVDYELTNNEKESLIKVLKEDYGDAFEKKYLNPEKLLKDAPNVLTATYFEGELFLKYGWMVTKLIELSKHVPLVSKIFKDDPKTYDPSLNIPIAEKIPHSFYEKWRETRAYKKYFEKLIKSTKRLEKILSRFGYRGI